MPFDGSKPKRLNFAPVKPLADAKRTAKSSNGNDSNLNAIFRDLYRRTIDEYDAGFRQVIEQARVIQNLYSGKLVMKKDMGGEGYVLLKPLKRPRSSHRSNFPVFPQNFTTLLSKWIKSKPIMSAQVYGDGLRSTLAARGVDMIVKHYFRRFFDGPENFYEAHEGHSALEYGTYMTQFYYDDRINQIRQVVPIIQNENKVVTPGYGACLSGCGFEGHPSDFQKTQAPYPQCPQCGGFKTTAMVPDAMADVANIVGAEEIVQGDIACRLLNFAATRFDPHVYAHQSDTLIYHEYVPLGFARSLVGDEIELNPGEFSDINMQILDSLAMRGGSIEGAGENEYDGFAAPISERTPLTSMWLKPEAYTGIKLKKPEQTVSGTIPADVPFEQIWPEGVCVMSFEGMNLQVGVFAEEANVASSTYLTVSHSGIGKSIADGVDVAKDINEVHSMAMAGLKKMGATGLVIDANSGITQEMVRDMLKPGKGVFVDTKGSGLDDIRKAVTQLQLNPVNPVLPQYAVQLNNLLNMVTMTGDFTQGMVQDVDINTLGGQQLAHAKAEEAKGIIYSGKVFHRKQCAPLIVKLVRKHMQLPRWYSNSDDPQAQARGKYITGVDLPTDIEFISVADSEVPVNPAERKIASRELFEKAGGITPVLEAATMFPQDTAFFLSTYGIKLPSLDQDQVQLVCLSRLDQIIELSNIYDDPMVILDQLTKKVRIDESMHILKAGFLESLLDDDEADQWSPLVMATVQMLINLHYDYMAESDIKKQMIAANAQMRLEQNILAGRQAMLAPIVEQEEAKMRGQQMEDQATQFAGDIAGRMMDEESADADHQRQMEREAAGTDRQLMLEREKARLAPKPQPKRAAK